MLGAAEADLPAARSNVTEPPTLLKGKVKKYMGRIKGYQARTFVLMDAAAWREHHRGAPPPENSCRLVLEISKLEISKVGDIKYYDMIDTDLPLNVTDKSITQTTNRSITYNGVYLTINTPEGRKVTLTKSEEPGHGNALESLWTRILQEARVQWRDKFDSSPDTIPIFESRFLDYETYEEHLLGYKGGDTYVYRELSLYCDSDGNELHILYSGNSGEMKTKRISDNPFNCPVKCLSSGIEFTFPSGKKTLTVKRPDGSDFSKEADFLKLRCCLWFYCSGTFMDTKMLTEKPIIGPVEKIDTDAIIKDVPRTFDGDAKINDKKLTSLLHTYVSYRDVPVIKGNKYIQGMNYLFALFFGSGVSILGQPILELCPLLLRSVVNHVYGGGDLTSGNEYFGLFLQFGTRSGVEYRIGRSKREIISSRRTPEQKQKASVELMWLEGIQRSNDYLSDDELVTKYNLIFEDRKFERDEWQTIPATTISEKIGEVIMSLLVGVSFNFNLLDQLLIGPTQDYAGVVRHSTAVYMIVMYFGNLHKSPQGGFLLFGNSDEEKKLMNNSPPVYEDDALGGNYKIAHEWFSEMNQKRPSRETTDGEPAPEPHTE